MLDTPFKTQRNQPRLTTAVSSRSKPWAPSMGPQIEILKEPLYTIEESYIGPILATPLEEEPSGRVPIRADTVNSE